MIRARAASYSILIALSLTGTGPAGGEQAVGDIIVSGAWSRPLPSVSANGAAYLTLHNQGADPDRLVGASSPAAGRTELHSHTEEAGLTKMRRLEAADIPAGGTLTLAPGGLHLMLLGLTSPMSEGRTFPLRLRFERAGEIEVVVTVAVPTTAPSMRQGSHHGGAPSAPPPKQD